MLMTLVLIVHIIVCIALILIILLQSGKGADIGAVFGGGSSQTLFGSSGATPFLSKVTIGAAVIFMCTSIFLTYFGGRAAGTVERSLVSGPPETEAPVGQGEAIPPTGTPGGIPAPEKKEGAPAATVPAPESSAPAAPTGGSESKAAPVPGGTQQSAPANPGAKAPESK